MTEMYRKGRQVTPASTRSGQEIWFEEPERTEILDEDLYRATRGTLRYAGHLEVSLLLHLAVCARIAEVTISPDDPLRSNLVAYCAAHDLHEAYVGDVISGLKQLIPDYREIEDAWEAHVHRSLGFEWPPPPDIARWTKWVDRRALVAEQHHFDFPLWRENAANLGGPPNPSEAAAFTVLCGMSPPVLWKKVRAALDGYRKPL